MTPPASKRPWWILATAALAGLVILLSPPGGWLSRPLLDAQLRHLAPVQGDPSVVVFDIDDASLAALKPVFGTWPFKRDVYALVIDQLRDLGARAVAIDLVLADGHDGDVALARAAARPGAPVVLAAAGLKHPSDELRAPLPAPGGTTPPALPAYVWPALALPTPTVWPDPTAPPRLGVITTPLDDDGVLRRLPLWHQAGTQRLPVMPLAVLQAVDPPQLAAAVRTDAGGAALLAFPARTALPAQRPFSDLAQVALGRRDAATLRDSVQGRVVFIGSSALLADAVMTTQGQASGTAVLAQAYAALRQGHWVHPPALALDLLLLAVALLPAAAMVWRGQAVPARDAAATGLAVLVVAGTALTALVTARQATQLGAPLVVLVLGLVLALLAHQRHQAARERQLALEAAVAADAARAKSAFLANISHEMRTPLNALLGVADLLADSPLSAEQRRHVQVFRDSGRALHDLINDLLDLSKIEADRLELDLQPFSLHRSLQHLVALMRPRAESKGLQLRLDLAPDLPDGVRGDRLRVEQGLMNLLGNAIKFTHQGEVRLGARPDADHPGQVRFEVADTGIGIAPSKLDTIFEPFAQADGSITRLYGGTGLGLALTRSVAQLMGGAVLVDSTPGVGSVFVLRLPLPEAPLAAEPAAPARAAAAAGATAALRVLLAEDNEVNVYIFRAMLADQPVAVEVAPNGPTALDLLQRQAFDLAFIDVQMPGMDGLSVTRELRRLEASQGRRRTPVVALTANAYASDVQASLDAGCDRHVSKPFAKGQLLEALEQLAVPAPSSTVSMPGPAAEVIDDEAAIRRLDGDIELYQRLTEHAAVFMAAWGQSFEQAVADGQLDRARGLAQDLGSIASSLGAQALTQAAAALLPTLGSAGATGARPDAAALARVHRALAPVIVALTLRSDRG